jgi:alpha-ketoglutarate-dependent taurine dioxygenase
MSAIPSLSHINRTHRPLGIELTRLEANLGAEVSGLELTAPLTPQARDLLRSLLWEHQVLILRDTGIDDARQAEIARLFGEPQADSIAKRRGVTDEQIVPFDTGPYAKGYYGTLWHADATYLEQPYFVSVLRSVIAPAIGGDTVFSSGVSAYESLPEEVKTRISGLTAIHRPDSKARALIQDQAELRSYLAEYGGVEHTLVITHAFSGRKVLYVNETFTHEIVGLPAEESKQLLTYLTHQFYRPENQLRLKWQPGSLAIWDNRAVQHYGVADYGNAQRRLVRIVARGNRPSP